MTFTLYMFCSIVFEKTCQEQLQLSRLFQTFTKNQTFFFFITLNEAKKTLPLKTNPYNAQRCQDFLSYILWYFDLNVYPEARFATDADLEKVGRRRSLTSVMPACAPAGSKEAMLRFSRRFVELIRLIEEIL